MVNLVLVAWDDRPEPLADLHRLSTLVHKLDPTIRTRVASNHKRAQLALLPLWLSPSVSISMLHVSRKLLPGRVLMGKHMDKIREYECLGQAGIPVPRWAVITRDATFDPEVWGPYLVEKPSTGAFGANVKIRKTSRVRWTPPNHFPEDHRGRDGAMIAQEFIYTGEWPTSYRVVTFFGEVLLCYRLTTADRGTPMKSRWDFASGGMAIVSNTKDMRVQFADDPEILDLAQRAHRLAFSDIPVLSFDVIRDADSGKLYVLECHPHGSGWMFSSVSGLGIQAASGLVFEEQYDAFRKSAEILARLAPIWATRRRISGVTSETKQLRSLWHLLQPNRQ